MRGPADDIAIEWVREDEPGVESCSVLDELFSVLDIFYNMLMQDRRPRAHHDLGFLGRDWSSSTTIEGKLMLIPPLDLRRFARVLMPSTTLAGSQS